VLKEGGSQAPSNAPPAEKSKDFPFQFQSITSCHFIIDKKWAEMLEELPENDVRYAVIDIFYETSEGSRAEIFFISW